MMKRIRAAFAALAGTESRAVVPPQYFPGGEFGSVGWRGGVNPTTAENLSLVASAVGVIASAMSSLPAYVYRKTENGREIDERHPLTRLIEEGPNRHQSWADWIEWSMAQVLLRGNGLSEIVRDGRGMVTAIEPLPWDGVSVLRLGSGKLAYDAVRVSDLWGSIASPQRFLEGEVVHVRDRSDDGLIGRSRLSRSPAVFASALAVQETASDALGNLTAPSGTLSAPNHIPEDTAKRLKEQMEAGFGRGNLGRFMVAGDGLKFERIMLNPEDAELLDSRRFSAEEIARLFNLPPPLAGIWDNSTFTNSETAGRWFGMFCLAPWCRKIEAEIKRSVFTDQERLTHSIELDMSALLRGDFAARWAAYKIAVDADILTRNEVREIEGFNPRADGDAPATKPAPVVA
jgi:HK97 family phage portal protein